MKQKKDYKKIWLAAGIVCAAAAVIAVCYIINDTMRRRDTASAYEEMASETNAVPERKQEPRHYARKFMWKSRRKIWTGRLCMKKAKIFMHGFMCRIPI